MAVALWCTLAVTLLFSLPALLSFARRDVDSSTCAMSYIWPREELVPVTAPQSRLAHKYRLHRYHDRLLPLSDGGVPCLFVPGNAGSWRQVRSLVTAVASVYIASANGSSVTAPLDIFTLDLNEEMTAFHGSSLLQQAEFVNDAIKVILSQYANSPDSSQKFPSPTSVMIVGHSVGGFVARTALCLPNFVPGSILSIVTLATPHFLPASTLEHSVSTIYTYVNEFWRRENHLLEQSLLQQITLERPSSQLEGVTLISISGGTLDTMISSDLTDIASIVSSQIGFTIFTTSIPLVWTSMDHLSVMWCLQFMRKLSLALLLTVNLTSESKVISVPKRLELFRDLLTGKFTDEAPHSFNGIMSPTLPPTTTPSQLQLTPYTINHTLETNLFALPITDDRIFQSQQYRIRIPREMILTNDISLLTDTLPTQIQAFICPYEGLPLYQCKSCTEAMEVNKLPAFGTRTPFDSVYYYLRLSVSSIRQLVTAQSSFILLQINITKPLPIPTTFMHINGGPIDNITISSSLFDLAFSSSLVSIPLKNLYSRVNLPTLRNSLFSYRVIIRGLAGRQLLIRQSHSILYESKYHCLNTLEAQDEKIFFLNFHGLYRPAISATKGISLEIWRKPSSLVVSEEETDSPANISIEISIDWFRSCGQLAKRYYSIIVIFPAAIGWLVFRQQWRVYHKTGLMPSFKNAVQHILRYAPLHMLLLTAVSLLQCTVPHLFSFLSSPSRYFSHRAIGIDTAITLQTLSGTILLGTRDPVFAILLPSLFWTLGIGYLCLMYGVCWSLVSLLSYIVRIVRHTVTTPLRKLGWSEFTLVKPELKRRIVILCMLILTVIPFMPYQFSLIIVILIHLYYCVTLRVASYQHDHVPLSTQSHHGLIEKRLSLDRFQSTFMVFLLLLVPSIIPQIIVWVRGLSYSYRPARPQPSSIYASEGFNFLFAVPLVLFVLLYCNGNEYFSCLVAVTPDHSTSSTLLYEMTISSPSQIDTDIVVPSPDLPPATTLIDRQDSRRRGARARANSTSSSSSSTNSTELIEKLDTAQVKSVSQGRAMSIYYLVVPRLPSVVYRVIDISMLIAAVILLLYGVYAMYYHEWVLAWMTTCFCLLWYADRMQIVQPTQPIVLAL